MNAGSNGTVIVTGAGSTWTNSGELSVGVGTGQLTVRRGGQVTNKIGTIGSSTAGVGTVAVSGTGSLWVNNGGLSVGIPHA